MASPLDSDLIQICPAYNWTSYIENNQNLIQQIQVEFLKQEFGRITQIFKVINASRISGIVARCNKTAFVAPSIYIKSRQFLLNILGGKKSHLSRKPYLETSDTIFPSRAYILVTKLGPIGDRFKGRIAKIIEGGFYQFWEDLYINLHTDKGIGIHLEDTVVQQELNSNILTIFYILSTSVCVCCVIFILEIGIGRRKRILERLIIFLVRCITRLKNFKRKILQIRVVMMQVKLFQIL